MHPEHAKNVFGEEAVMRGNLLQLGMILGAREILTASPDEPAFQFEASVEEELRSLLDALPDEQRSLAREFLSMENRKRLARDLARRIIRDATGSELP